MGKSSVLASSADDKKHTDDVALKRKAPAIADAVPPSADAVGGSFHMSSCAQKRSPAPQLKIPRASDIRPQKPGMNFIPLPNVVVAQLGDPAVVIGIDVESHSWPNDSCRRGHTGQFGKYTMKDDKTLRTSRIVKIAWTVGAAEVKAPVEVKCKLIRPDGYEIADKATQFHGISQEQAMSEGLDLKEVMEEFMKDMVELCESGGRVVAHQLEFDAGLILEELQRCGLTHLQKQWSEIARAGYCTMNPDVGRWLKICAGAQVGPKQEVLSLTDSLDKLLPGASRTFKAHTPEDDAQMARLIFLALLQRAREQRKG